MSSLSCKKGRNEQKDNIKVAEAYNKSLFITDIPGLTSSSTNADSLTVINNYAREWAMDEVFIRKSKDQLSMARQKQIDEKVNNYRLSLYRYEYEKSLIAQKLDTSLSIEEIDSFVSQFPSNFQLEEDIIRFNIIVNPPPADITQLRRWLQSADYEELNKYCSRRTLVNYFGHDAWMPIATLYGLFPEAQINKLPNNEIMYLAAEGKRYLVQVIEYKKQGTPAPASFMRDEVRSALLQIKKAEFVDNIRKEMLQEAIKKKKVKIYP